MSYFTAVIAADGRGWRARDVDVTDTGALDDLADVLRGVATGVHPVIAVLEREDEWFAFVRVDGDDDPRVFVSDMEAAARSRFADLLAPAAEVDIGDDEDEDLDEDAEEPPEEPTGVVVGAQPVAVQVEDDGLAADLAEADAEPPGLASWAGEPDLLEDLGVSSRTLRDLVEERPDPAAVIGEVGEVCGFADLLEALR